MTARHAASRSGPSEYFAPPRVWPPLQLYLSTARRTVRTFLFTKDWLPRQWLASDRFPGRTDAIVHYGLPSRRECEVLRAQAVAQGSPLRFVGDLDPLDLAVFASLQRGGASTRTRAAPAVPVAYAGIDDSWLAMCERRLRGRPLRFVCIEQDAHEKKLFAKVVRAGLDVAALVGPRCAALLQEGMKLEIEGASNPAIYGADLMPLLLSRLLRKPR